MKIQRMIKFHFLTVIILLSSCSQSDYSQPEGSTIPLGAEVEAYDNVTGLVHVVVRDGENITKEGDYFNGLEHGTIIEYTADGQIQSATNFYLGEQFGTTILFKNNQIESKSNYQKGQLHGNYKKFDRRNVIEDKNYINGSLQGWKRKYYKNGTLMEEAYYEAGQLNGIAKWYNQEGELTIAYEYNNGELVDKNPEIED